MNLKIDSVVTTLSRIRKNKAAQTTAATTIKSREPRRSEWLACMLDCAPDTAPSSPCSLAYAALNAFAFANSALRVASSVYGINFFIASTYRSSSSSFI